MLHHKILVYVTPSVPEVSVFASRVADNARRNVVVHGFCPEAGMPARTKMGHTFSYYPLKMFTWWGRALITLLCVASSCAACAASTPIRNTVHRACYCLRELPQAVKFLNSWTRAWSIAWIGTPVRFNSGQKFLDTAAARDSATFRRPPHWYTVRQFFAPNFPPNTFTCQLSAEHCFHFDTLPPQHVRVCTSEISAAALDTCTNIVSVRQCIPRFASSGYLLAKLYTGVGVPC